MQILTLDGHNKETFRQEGDAEILELEGGETSGSSAERGMQTFRGRRKGVHRMHPVDFDKNH